MENKIWPCVKCTEQEYKEIRGQLLEWGYTDHDGDYIDDWETHPYLITGYTGKAIILTTVAYFSEALYDGHKLCKNTSEFLSTAKTLAIKNRRLKK